MRQRGRALLPGRYWGGRHLVAVEEHQLQLAGAPTDRERVLDALRLLDDTRRPTLFMLSFEACVALDPRLPRKPPDPSLGPDVIVWQCEDVPAAAAEPLGPPSVQPWHPQLRPPDAAARARHVARVRAAHEQLLEGVIYQANLAHRIEVAPASGDDGRAFFHAVTAQGGPPCAAHLDIPGWGSVVSLSPERFVVADFARRDARTFPIKGTRPRGCDPDEDARNRDSLCASEKDAAEHVMIVDLLRNDLGRCALPGGVTVERLLDVLSVKNVHHLESTIHARLAPGVRVSDLLVATVPGGSITGAPKSSAVEVICALEDGPRGPYTGVLGLLDGPVLKTALLIRTWLRPDDAPGSLHVGGGIVVDSDADAEWEETLHKAAAFGGRV